MAAELPQVKKQSLLKSTGIVSLMTFFSRILGFVRDMVIAHSFGAAGGVDAFIVALKIPNFLRRLFAEGAFAQAFVPILSEYQQTGSHQDVKNFIAKMSGVLTAILVPLSILAMLASPVLILIFAPGFGLDSTRADLASSMLRITFPYLLLITLTAFSGSVLNCYGRFSIPAITPAFFNIAIIGMAIFAAPHLAHPIYALAWGVALAGIVQLLFQLPFLIKLKLLVVPKPKWSDPGVQKVLKLMLPALFGVSVAQISILLDTIFASFLPVGSVSWLYYSDRLMQFPLGIFGVAVATVVLPHLSRKHADKSPEEYNQALDWSIKMILLLGLPAAVGLVLLSGPLLSSLFQYGKFSGFDVEMARQSLIAFAVGVPGFMLIKALASGFYAQQNIKTPVKIAVIAMVTNMLLNAILIWPLKHAGLALATSLSSGLNAGLLFYLLKKREIYKPNKGWGKFGLMLLIALGVMAAWCVFITPNLAFWLKAGWQWKASHLAVSVIGAGFLYVFTLWAMGMRLRHFKFGQDSL